MLEQAFHEYLEIERNYSEHTVIAYTKDVQDFAAFLQLEYGINLNDASELNSLHHKVIRNWMSELISGGNSHRTIARKIASLNTFYKFLQKSDRVKMNPASLVKVPKFEKKLPSFLKENAITDLFNKLEFPPTFEGQRDRSIMEVLYSCGLRRSELIDLNFNNIDFGNRTLKVMGKGRKERIIPFGQFAHGSMKDYIVTCDEAGLDYSNKFFIRENGQPLYGKLVHRIVERYLTMVCTLNKKSPHVLRHTFATHLLDRGADLNAIKELLGHKSLAATQVYVHNSISKLKDVYKKAHPKA